LPIDDLEPPTAQDVRLIRREGRPELLKQQNDEEN
jgi:hypothetical protein